MLLGFMEFVYSRHWNKKNLNKRKDIVRDFIEYAILNSNELRDKRWDGVLNVICRVPPSGRILKVVYKKLNAKVFIITAYWLS